MISFVGAGPGAPDLLTIRGAQRLAEADIVVWASSLVPEAVLDHCRPAVVLFDSKTMTLEEVTAVYDANPEAAIVRLHSGDPSVYGAIAEQIDWCVRHGLAFEIVPGVSQSVVLTRLANRTRSSMLPHEDVSMFAAHGVTMAIFLSAARPQELQDQLLSLGSRYTPETPAVLAFRVSWPDERIVRATVGSLADSLAQLGETATVLVLVGPALAPIADPQRSHVYSSSYAHTFRGAGE